MNLFKLLIMKCETQEIKNNQNNSILPILIEKIKSNYPIKYLNSIFINK